VPVPTIRTAGEDDVDAVLRLVRESAASQGALDRVCVDAATLRGAMTGPDPRVHALLADIDGRSVGLALYMFTFSTWTSVNGIHLEDLYVEPAARRGGVGRALMSALADIARERGCGRFQWYVLRSNDTARRFYESLGAAIETDWAIMSWH